MSKAADDAQPSLQLQSPVGRATAGPASEPHLHFANQKGSNKCAQRASAGDSPPTPASLTKALQKVRLEDEEEARRVARQQRFAADRTNLQEVDLPKHSITDVRSRGEFGTSQALEKEYFRLTSAPVASSVRPPDVLQKSLEHVKSRWQQERNYQWTCGQLKAIRQDLTVQHCRDALAVETYETHARLALQCDDVAEFRQCNGVLRLLYEEGQPGCAAEFAAYSLLFASSRGRQLLQEELQYVAQAGLLDHPYVQHALHACSAVRSGNLVAFLCLYRDAPCLCPLLMAQLLPALRVRLLRVSMVAYGPTCLPITFLASQLGMEVQEQASEFCQAQGLVLVQGGASVDCKASRAARGNTVAVQ